MYVHFHVLRAMLDCPYKAWLLAKEDMNPPIPPNSIPTTKITPSDKLAITASCYPLSENTSEKIQIQYGSDLSLRVALKIKPSKKAEQLWKKTREVTELEKPPVFYKNKHCPECQFKSSCYEKLQERDCISLLGNISPKVVAKYHQKGILSIAQLSHLFRPRRRSRRKPDIAANYLWELKALAIREHKTYVMYTPELIESDGAIYIDFEGKPDERLIYLIGGIIQQEGKPDEEFSFWADTPADEKEIYEQLFRILARYPDLPIYHYGSYEGKSLKQALKKYSTSFRSEAMKLEKRMVNLLTYMRAHVYPPTYSNGLKEIAGFLRFKWTSEDADGLHSLLWRKYWENSRSDDWKDKLIQYNREDCKALERVHLWLQQLAKDSDQEEVQKVEKMKRESPHKFRSNKEFGDDFNYINSAAYFDYQRSKIYWRNKDNELPVPKHSRENYIVNRPGKGKAAWRPKRVNEIVTAAPLKKCPLCGHHKVYQLAGTLNGVRQTDIKFTPTGVKQYVTEFRSTQAKCAKCLMKYNNGIIKRAHYGDNLMAWAINMYVNYHISHYLVSKLVLEQFGIWMNPMYLLQRKGLWWEQWKPEVKYIWEIIRNSPVIQIDETTIRLSKDKGYVWVFATSHTVFYYFTLSRESEFLKEWLKDYKGVIITDFFPGYDALHFKRQKCLIHLIRDLNDDLYKHPFDEEFKTIVVEFGKMLRDIIETIDQHGLQKFYLQKHSIVIRDFYQLHLEKEYKGELSVKYTKRLKKHWPELWTFIEHDDVPWNNNNAEVAIKAFAQHRRGVNGQVSEKGLQEYLEMLTIAQTCRYRNLSFLDFLRRKTGIWENLQSEALPAFLPFDQARHFMQRQGLKDIRQWNQWKEEGKRPNFIPSFPHMAYKNKGWEGFPDFLGK